MLLYLELTRTFAGHEKWDYDFIMHQLYPTCVYVLYVPSLIYINKILFMSTKKMHIWIGVATGGIYIYIYIKSTASLQLQPSSPAQIDLRSQVCSRCDKRLF